MCSCLVAVFGLHALHCLAYDLVVAVRVMHDPHASPAALPVQRAPAGRCRTARRRTQYRATPAKVGWGPSCLDAWRHAFFMLCSCLAG